MQVFKISQKYLSEFKENWTKFKLFLSKLENN